MPGPARIVAIGDLHGDLDATRAALRLAGAIDAEDRWIGGALVVVQEGDLLDRGDGERAMLDLTDRIAADAVHAGGALIVLNGNHELMNAAGDFRYVTPGGFDAFADLAPPEGAPPDPRQSSVPARARGRAAAFFPGGPYAKRLAGHDVAVIVGDTVFVHGGLTPGWAGRIAEANHDSRAWLSGTGPRPRVLDDDDGPVWTRVYGGDDVDCALLDRALAAVPARRMVVAHTVQPKGVTSACDGRVWRIDVGLAKLYGGPLEVLEIRRADDGETTARPVKGAR